MCEESEQVQPVTGLPLRPCAARVSAFFASSFVVANCTEAGPVAGGARDPRAAPVAAPSPVASRGSGSALACLAEAVYFEARGTGTKGETAVAHVIVNRAKSAEFPRTVCGVVGDGCQFSYRCNGRRTRWSTRARVPAPTRSRRTCCRARPTSPRGRCSSTRRRRPRAGSRAGRGWACSGERLLPLGGGSRHPGFGISVPAVRPSCARQGRIRP